MQAAIDAATALGALLLFPGNVYNYGAGMPAMLSPDTPQRPSTEKGRIRVDLEQQLAQATRTRGLQAVVIRAGDFFGAGSGSWLDQVIVKKLPQGRVTWPGALDAPHAWAYLPDLAQAFVRVAETTPAQAGGRFECLHFAGHTVTGQDWLAALTEVAWEQGWLPADGALRTGKLPWGDDAAGVAVQSDGGLAAGDALPVGRAARAGWRGAGAAHRCRAAHAVP